jgi:hypothetical protein
MIEKASTEKVTSEFNDSWSFAIFLESSNSKEKKLGFFLDFAAKKRGPDLPVAHRY